MNRPLVQGFSVLALILGALFAPTVADEQKPEENAALVYWQAFAQLPLLGEAQEELLIGASTTPLDDRTSKLAAADGALSALHRAAGMPYCQWGLDFTAGPHMVMPHLSKARQLARFACLRARHQLANGHQEAALGTVRDTLVLARHAGSDDVIISALVQHGIERFVIESVCRELRALEPQHLEALQSQLDLLPEGTSIENSLRLEKRVFLGWSRQVVQQAATDDVALAQLRSLVGSDTWPQANPAYTRTQLLSWINGTEQDYDEIHAIFHLPAEQFHAQWDAILSRVKKDNPFSALVLPAMEELRDVHDRNIATWALFRAALAVANRGKAALSSAKDPFASQPFAYTQLSNGFRLSSQLILRGQPVELTIGPAAGE